MENKRKYLFITVIALFIVSFYTINLRFDPFYRVNGINNDNRMIIEKYLSKEEQKYLVENRIPLYHFMKYIKYDDFYLPSQIELTYIRDNLFNESIDGFLVWNSLTQRVPYWSSTESEDDTGLTWTVNMDYQPYGTQYGTIAQLDKALDHFFVRCVRAF